MFIKILLSYLSGYLRIEVTGYYIERFINLCNSNHVLTWNIKKQRDSSVLLNIGVKELKKVVKFAKKTKCRIKIKNKKGFPFILNRYKKRKAFVGALLVIILAIVISSNFIWNIEIKSEDGNTIDNIEQDVLDAGLKIGMLKAKLKILHGLELN